MGLWRELRRLTEASADADIERARARADVGDWAGFIRAVSFEGIRAGRRVDLHIEREETGELSKYAEVRPAPIVGVRCCSSVEITRPHHWRIQRCGTVAHEPHAHDAHGAPLRSGTGDVHGARLDDVPALPSLCAGRLQGSGEAVFVGGRSRSGLVGLRLNPLFRDLHGKPKRKGRTHQAATSGSNVPAKGRAGAPSGAPCSSSSVFSSLGPVAITVRGNESNAGSGAHVRSLTAAKGDGPTCRAVTGAGAGGNQAPLPVQTWREWDATMNKFERAHGRYPDVIETRALWRPSQ